ncbi:sigma-E processing peptidase SpoIIGA [Clostridium vincentii]|uniref:Sporulation sigma-E factor-processing peptidase n=1 Tax=Clostridium vincentii TaxID=52704 RepID=A0A2T0BCU5_9CLOT|nr:sigma-E processing peptidase SpoIIGA [Clostridium vincentii]PRR81653.1 Sporulation factor SpoIIGA [Clostridium vincentii]
MEIYLDIILLENFIVDMFLLSVTFSILRCNVENKKVIVASLLGALYTIVMIFPAFNILSAFPFALLVAYLMMLIILGRHRYIFALKATGVFLLSSITLSGICFVFSSMENKYSFTKGFTISNYSLKYFVISIMILYILYNRAISYFRERAIIGNYTYDIEITIKNVKYIIKGFLDTGNELREPVTNLPCIIVEKNLFSNYEVEDDKAYYINYSSIGYKGKLKGFKVDKVRIKSEGQEFREVNALICHCDDILSRDKDFNALLSRGVI